MDQFDPAIAEQLWESLPPECRRETFDKKTLPDRYRPFVRAESAGGSWTTVALNMTGLPRTITWELAWLLHREIELGRTIYPHRFNGMVRAMRAATSSGTRAGREARSLLSLGADQWVREVQAARLRGQTVAPRDTVLLREYVKRLQDVLCYAYQTGEWWRLDVWNPGLDRRIPAQAGECDAVERGVGLAVAAAVEPSSLGLAGGCLYAAETAEGGEGCLAAEPVWVVAGGDEQGSCAVGPDPGALQQCWGVHGDRLGDPVLQVTDLALINGQGSTLGCLPIGKFTGES